MVLHTSWPRLLVLWKRTAKPKGAYKVIVAVLADEGRAAVARDIGAAFTHQTPEGLGEEGGGEHTYKGTDTRPEGVRLGSHLGLVLLYTSVGLQCNKQCHSI